ncbi:MAG: DUF6106 family protein [Lachnospiraceae bacterium]|nr:DUF6106 family protein [Lachnospiraceae bacterium]
MNDSYVEWLIKRKVPFYAYLLNAVLGIVTAVSIVLAFTTGVLAVLIMFVCVFVTYLSYRNTRVEFEYLYVDDQFSIDRIFGKAKRKKYFECSTEAIQMIAPSESDALKAYPNAAKVLDASSHQPGAKTYTVMVQQDGETRKLIIEPNDKLLQSFRRSMPRKVVQ